MYILSVADKYSDMTYRAAVTGEKYQISGNKLGFIDTDTVVSVHTCRLTGDADSEVSENISDKPRTVKSGC